MCQYWTSIGVPVRMAPGVWVTQDVPVLESIDVPVWASQDASCATSS